MVIRTRACRRILFSGALLLAMVILATGCGREETAAVPAESEVIAPAGDGTDAPAENGAAVTEGNEADAPAESGTAAAAGSVITVSGTDAASAEGDRTEMTGDYVEHQVICMTDTKEEAEKIAGEVGGELTSYSYGVGTIHIEETVQQLMDRLSRMKNPPEVYPNHVMHLDDSGMGGDGGMQVDVMTVPDSLE